MELPSKHIEFVQLVAKGVQQEEAYRLTIGNKHTTSGSARAQGSKLCKKYAVFINEERERLRKVVEAANDSKVSEIAQKRIMSSAERMEWLTKLVDGTIKAKRPFVVGGKIMEYPEEPSHADRVRALAELNKMDGSYAPAKTETTLTDTRPASKITMKDGTIIEL